jgi:uncharacterized membrane protein
VHIGAGAVALAIGFYILARRKGTQHHRLWGRRFVYFAAAVCVSAAAGTLFFRFIPVFAILTVLVPYQLIGGWRSAMTRDAGPAVLDALWTAIALVLSSVLVPVLLEKPDGRGVVAKSTLAALCIVLLYDMAKWLFPRRWFRQLWKYEHSYKLVSAQFGMLSALVGNVVRFGQPWSQLLPSVAGVLTIGYYFWRLGSSSPSHQTSRGQ